MLFTCADLALFSKSWLQELWLYKRHMVFITETHSDPISEDSLSFHIWGVQSPGTLRVPNAHHPGFGVDCSSGETRSSPWSVRSSTAVTGHGLGRKAHTAQTAIAHKLKPYEP